LARIHWQNAKVGVREEPKQPDYQKGMNVRKIFDRNFGSAYELSDETKAILDTIEEVARFFTGEAPPPETSGYAQEVSATQGTIAPEANPEDGYHSAASHIRLLESELDHWKKEHRERTAENSILKTEKEAHITLVRMQNEKIKSLTDGNNALRKEILTLDEECQRAEKERDDFKHALREEQGKHWATSETLKNTESSYKNEVNQRAELLRRFQTCDTARKAQVLKMEEFLREIHRLKGDSGKPSYRELEDKLEAAEHSVGVANINTLKARQELFEARQQNEKLENRNQRNQTSWACEVDALKKELANANILHNELDFHGYKYEISETEYSKRLEILKKDGGAFESMEKVKPEWGEKLALQKELASVKDKLEHAEKALSSANIEDSER
jgi:chromosome segregation ATPase